MILTSLLKNDNDFSFHNNDFTIQINDPDYVDCMYPTVI